MGDIDETSAAIGRLLADMESSQRQRANLFEKVDGVAQALSRIESAIHSHVEADNRVAARVDIMEGIIAKHSSIVEQSKGMGKMATLIYTVFGASAVTFALQFFQGGGK